jgi:hypothetical protein
LLSSTIHQLLDACRELGCPVCSMGTRTVGRYLESLFYEYVNDPGIRESLLKSQGFCREHAQLLLNTRIASGFGASILYLHIVDAILENWSDPARAKFLALAAVRFGERISGIRQRGGLSSGAVPCLACEQRNTAEDHALDELSKSLGDEKIQLALNESDGLCFPHLTQLLESIQEPNRIQFLFDLTRGKLETRRSEMSELIRKNDHRFRSEEISLEEALAWKKVMCMISGARISQT